MNRRAVVLAAVAVGLVIGAVVFQGLQDLRRVALADLAAQQRRVASGVYSLFVDDCGGLAPEPERSIPARLSTPIAYLSAEEMHDPFGRRGEDLLFVPNHYYNNAAAFAIISRGPDGDLDALRLPKRSVDAPKGKPTPPPLLMLPDGMLSWHGPANVARDSWFIQQGVHPYDPTNGARSDGDCIGFY